MKTKKLTRIEIESLRDSIRSQFNVHIDYDNYEQELMRELEFGHITAQEFEEMLTTNYIALEAEESEEE